MCDILHSFKHPIEDKVKQSLIELDMSSPTNGDHITNIYKKNSARTATKRKQNKNFQIITHTHTKKTLNKSQATK